MRSALSITWEKAKLATSKRARSVRLLGAGKPLPFRQEGKALSINVTNVPSNAVDTILVIGR
jgi:hypothetical protein